MHHFTLHKTMYHAVMLWAEHLIKNNFFELDGVLIWPPFFDTPKTVLRSLRWWFYPEHDCMIHCLVQRELMHEKGLIKKPFLRPLAATVIQAETCQSCWTTGTSPSWRVCLYCDISRQCWTKGAQHFDPTLLPLHYLSSPSACSQVSIKFKGYKGISPVLSVDGRNPKSSAVAPGFRSTCGQETASAANISAALTLEDQSGFVQTQGTWLPFPWENAVHLP